MNTDQLKGNWKQFVGKAKEKWGKLTDNDIDSVNGHMDQIAGKVQQVYGYAKEKAEQEFKDFKASLSSAKDSTKESVSAAKDTLTKSSH